MESAISSQPVQLTDLLAQHVEGNRDELVGRYLAVLREALFASRANLRPSSLKQIATDEADALLYFLKQPGFSAAGRGEQLHRAGLNVGAVLRLSQVTRQFLLKHSEHSQIALILEVLDSYEMTLVEGFIQSIDNTNKIERLQLERVLTSLYKSGDS